MSGCADANGRTTVKAELSALAKERRPRNFNANGQKDPKLTRNRIRVRLGQKANARHAMTRRASLPFA